MKAIIINPINELGLNHLLRYVNSITSPSTKDKLRMWKAHQIEKLIYGKMPKPKMLREEWDDKTNIYSLIVEEGYEQYSNEILEKAKLNFLKIVDCSENNFNFEVKDD